jgi:Zn finger protein HypA/HybF involved in hydrogenase expression
VLAAAHFTPSPAIGAVIVIVGVAVVVACLLRDVRRHPVVVWCRACGGSGRRRSRWNPAAFGPCPACGGKPTRRRRGAPPE